MVRREKAGCSTVCGGGVCVGEMVAKMILSVKRPHGRNELVTFKAGQKAVWLEQGEQAEDRKIVQS